MEGKHNDVVEYLLRSKRIDPAQLDIPDTVNDYSPTVCRYHSQCYFFSHKFGNFIIELAEEWNPAVVPLLTQYRVTNSFCNVATFVWALCSRRHS